MLDREKVIKGLNYLYDRVLWKEGFMTQDDKAEKRREIIGNALTFLQEQEPVCTEYDNSIVLFSCRDCKTQLLYGQRHCHMCGRKIKWK